ncbi:MAG: polysaccharide pyruvyl transferase family protein [Bacteroidaceae bacterium]|nr:polysaccharide pyruvyl transferase family protein [Bacteroidaceae bacterium]
MGKGKKTGVLTFWYGDSNYGQILQCYALQRVLEQLGCEPYVVRFVGYGESRLRKLVKQLLPFLCRKPSPTDRLRGFEAFRKEHFRMSPLYTSIAQIRSCPPRYDAYIAGSDQIWKQSLRNPQQPAYFLDFGRPEVRRIAYAASFGMEHYPDGDKAQLKGLLQRFDAISCREYSGVEICRDLGLAAQKVLDPTLLLTREEYLNLNPNLNEGKNSSLFTLHSSLFIYSLNINSASEIRWSELREAVEGKVVVTPAAGYNESAELFGSEVEYLYATPAQWIAQIASASLVVTTSFHGIAFSILMHTPFVYVPLKGEFEGANNRILDLLRDLRLEERILSERTTYADIIVRPIDWASVDTQLERMRQDSLAFLKEALK